MSHAEENAGTRRDFLYYATAGAGAVATGAAVWPLVNQMNPSADVQALSSIFVDVSGVEVGTQLTVKWLGKPVFIRRRSPEEIDAARNTALTDLVAEGGLHLCLDGFHMGIGGDDSWSQSVRPEYWLQPGGYYWNCVLR